ncbi:gliding motility-associated C-terminal domain-containing protein [Xanthovirga aplysinae]|uniref:gliding motility-associated C-terminal domain-containing protein n=1 Tax=Xanthovirga aplysinae TaxID=2529853 RepID=UPI0012BBADCF|nr:gliding motility-associated C-terminal domain-containing protein [Xanthovirga aplysinae]MTI33547.1 gliding motility-associated C-terminal domain-containing protein [Xanthovirga aplysinae]
MKYFLAILALFISLLSFGQTVENPSFEGQRSSSSSPPGWYPCNEYSTPDTQPGSWNISRAPSDGGSFISMVTRGNNGQPNDYFTEAIATRLNSSFEKNVCYNISIDMAHDPNFDGRGGWDPPPFFLWEPVKLKVWLSNSQCQKTKLVYESPLVDHTDWKAYNFNFSVEEDYNTLILEANYASNTHYNGSILLDNLSLEKEELEIFDEDYLTLCTETSTNLNVDISNVNILWSTGSTNNTIEVQEEGTYWVQVEKQNCIFYDTIKVEYLEPLIFELGNDTTLCPGEVLQLDVSTDNGNYLWNDGSTSPNYTIEKEGSYSVSIDNGCEIFEDQITVYYREECCGIEAPNVFTPNGDNVNDLFEIKPSPTIARYNFKIFNRWGKVVYQTENVNNFWDGTINGKEAASGVYYWVATLLCLENDQITDNQHKGSVTLLR